MGAGAPVEPKAWATSHQECAFGRIYPAPVGTRPLDGALDALVEERMDARHISTLP
jgi:hypothetical protein